MIPRFPSAATLQALARAGLPLVPGMMLLNGHRVAQVDAGGTVRLHDVRHDQSPLLVNVAGAWRWVQDDRVEPRALPDPGDRGTFMLLLDLLAARLGRDSAAGALWTRCEGGWQLTLASGPVPLCSPALATCADPDLALALALGGEGQLSP